MNARLVMPDGAEIEVGAHCQIGRAPGAAIRIESPGVSRQHAVVHRQQNGDETECWVADLGSTNGTIRTDASRFPAVCMMGTWSSSATRR